MLASFEQVAHRNGERGTHVKQRTEDHEPAHTGHLQEIPDRTAQVFNRELYHGDHDGKFTYREMLARVEDLSCGLSLGFARGDRVGSCPELALLDPSRTWQSPTARA